MPAGESKKRALGALTYLSKAFAGKPQPLRGLACPKGTLVIHT
jgi:hypothetical protein